MSPCIAVTSGGSFLVKSSRHSGANTSSLLSDVASDSGAWEKVVGLEAGAQSVEEVWPRLSSVHSSSYKPQWWFAQVTVQMPLLEEERPTDQ